MGKRSSTTETLFGTTDGINATGTFPMQSFLGETTLLGTSAETYAELDIPKGIRAKIWIEKISGNICTVNVFYNANPTSTTSTSYTQPTSADVQVDGSQLTSLGLLEEDDRRPLIVDGNNPGTAVARIQFKWSQTVAAASTITVKIEWSVIDQSEEY